MDLNKVKLSLENRIVELNQRAKEIDEELSEPADDDWAENASESEGDEVNEKLGKMAQDEITKINLALAKLKQGTYGLCSNCKEKISLKRLASLPYATLCVECGN